MPKPTVLLSLRKYSLLGLVDAEYDNNLNILFKCSKFCHCHKKYHSTTVPRCRIYAGDYLTEKCNNKENIKYRNWLYFNIKYNRNRKVDNKANDINKCEPHLTNLKERLEGLDYPYNLLNSSEWHTKLCCQQY